MAFFSFTQTIVTFVYLFFVFTCTAASLLTHDEECLALFQFKQSFFHQDDDASFDDSGGFQKFESWRMITSNASDNDCCLWKGVLCSSEGHVTGLDLSQSFLRGRIDSSSSLFKLVHLQKLNLSMNDLAESRIPSEIARLKQLRILDLSNSSFGGQIPKEISHLVQLSVLDLSWNPLKIQNYSLRYLLKNMTRLEKLHLSEVVIGSFVPHFLANFSSLWSIKLRSCGLQDEFPSSIFHLPQLKYLSLSNNSNLTGSLPEFRNNSLLEFLSLYSTGFAGIIPRSISNLNHLEGLDLYGCHFSGLIPGSLSNLTQLTWLCLGQNNLRGPVPSLASLSKLVYLDLTDCTFENGRIPYWLSKLTRLNELNLNRSSISDKIPPSIANLTRLSTIAMANNIIYGRIPSSFMNLTQLITIDLQTNQLQGPISSDFSNFKSLEYLNLRFNNFSGQIPSSFMNLTQLITIDLKGNQLQGPISSDFSNFKYLEYLNLGSNNFSGIVDLDTFVGLNKLESLYLGYNKISVVATTNNYTDDTLPQLKNLGLSSCNLKEFPAFLRFRKNMNALFLDVNKIEGLVPVWIWNNSQETMQIVALSSNFITGFQQNPCFLRWVNLGALWIRNNLLQGRLPIPPPTTIFYALSHNNLTGEIPSSICEAKSLQLLDLSFNNMDGTLPSCLGNLSNSLSVLNLKRNNFHGTMMNAFTHGSMLKMIDLSENHFTGQLSKSITNCTGLQVLSLGDNSFDDHFPSWLGHLPGLQVLILRSNKFHGAIHGPRSDTTQFSNLRIIDLSNNSFGGQLPVKYIQSWKAMKSIYVGKSIAENLDVGFIGFLGSYEYSMTLTHKGVKREYEKITKLFIVIDLSCNKFEGPIPQELQNLQGLQSLNLSNNHLTGRILPALGNLTNLESLDLSHNELSGDIPQQLLQLGFLEIFNVSFNRLNGCIPHENQFSTFDNNSYFGNPGLCGEPLSKECQDSKTSTFPSTSSNESESFLPSDVIDWIVVFTGVASGLVIGIVIGNILYERYCNFFIDRFRLRNDRWIRPLNNTRRN